MPVTEADLYDPNHSAGVDIQARRQPYKGMCSRDVYQALCRQHSCKVNTGVYNSLPQGTDEFDFEALDLSKNMVGPRGVIPLMEVVRLSAKLKTMNLSNNYLDNSAVRSIAMALKDHPSIEAIDFTGNPISWTAGMHILELITQNPSLQKVDTDATFLKPKITNDICMQAERNQAIKAKKQLTGANPTNHPLAIRIRALKRMFQDMVDREGTDDKVPKRCAVEGYKENMRMQSRENELDAHSVAFYEDLKRRCNADEMGLITWETFLIVGMIDDVGYNDEEVAVVRKIFEKYDTDRNGYIDLKELGNMIMDFNQSPRPPTTREVQERMNLFDADHSNTLTFDEFIIMMIDKGPQ
eukprot:gene8299-12812_t